MGLKPVYRCWYSWTRGRTVCSNTLTVPQDRADLAVLRAIQRDVLDREVVEAALTRALDELTRADNTSTARREELRGELVRLETELARYADAIAGAGALDTILQAMQTRENHRDAIRRELATLAPRKAREVDGEAIRATLTAHLADWTMMARQGVAEARRLLREVLVDRIVFRPVPRPPEIPPEKRPGRKARLVYEFVGEASLSSIFAGLISGLYRVSCG